MGFWKLNNGKEVEMIFDDDGKFIRFGDNVSDQDKESVTEELTHMLNAWRSND